jgi:hypothetical protein
LHYPWTPSQPLHCIVPDVRHSTLTPPSTSADVVHPAPQRQFHDLTLSRRYISRKLSFYYRSASLPPFLPPPYLRLLRSLQCPSSIAPTLQPLLRPRAWEGLRLIFWLAPPNKAYDSTQADAWSLTRRPALRTKESRGICTQLRRNNVFEAGGCLRLEGNQ